MNRTYSPIQNKSQEAAASVRLNVSPNSVSLRDNRPQTVDKEIQLKKYPGSAITSNSSTGVIQRLGSPLVHANLANPGSYVAGTIPLAGNIAPHVASGTVATTIVHNNVALAPITEGSTMTAFPISNRTSAGGSETTDAVRTVSRAASAFYGKRYIAGHLLNNHLGGPGNNLANITAITSKSNSQHHAGIENDLKNDVWNGYIAHYHVDCSTRAPFIPAVGPYRIHGLAKSLVASYSLLKNGGDPATPGDYQPVRYLSLNLDPGGTGQSALRDGQAMYDAEVVYENMLALFTNKASSGPQFETLLKHAHDNNMDATTAINYILLNPLTDPTDRGIVQSHLEEFVRE